jgi:hypothetical protein
MKRILSIGFYLCGFLFAASVHGAAYSDRFVWLFGWGLGKDSDAKEISRVLESASKSGLNGVVFSSGLDSLCKATPDYLRRLDQLQRDCQSNHLELIPSVFSIGYGGGILAHDKNLAEGLLVEDAPFVVSGNDVQFSNGTNLFHNGGFEQSSGNKPAGFDMLDQPGEVGFIDTAVKHTGDASLRMENFTSNPHGHGRVMQVIKVHPRRCYRVSLWVKTEKLQPPRAFKTLVLAGNRELAPREFGLPSTTDWRKISFLFNSQEYDKVSLYAGLWEGKSGRIWLDDWSVEEIGPVNALRRPGTPVTVRADDGSVIYTEGKDYSATQPGDFSPWHDHSDPLRIKLLPGSRIKDGQRLRVSWYHSMLVLDSQVTVCMAEPKLYEIMDHEAQLLAERLKPKAVLLSMDEVRMAGTCKACQGRDLGELLGECVTHQAQILQKHIPGVRVYVWSDMLDPNHNAHGDYYLARGSFDGSWKHIPKDLVIAVWGGEPREKSLRFFADQGFKTLVACYYDADNLDDVRGWLALARTLPNVRGFMYTPWQKKYDLLPGFGELISK